MQTDFYHGLLSPTLMKFPTRRMVLVWAMYGGLSVLICAPLFARPNGVGRADWDQHLFYYASVLKSVIEYGQWPFWNPWYCGGNVLWQNPQVALLSPAYPLALVLSLPLAMKVNIVVHYWIGFIGMHMLLTRVAGVRFLPLVMYLACVFVASGSLALHVAEGHSTFLTAFYLPLLLFFIGRSMSSGGLREGMLAGALLGLMVNNGGLHIVPMAVISIGVFATVAAARRQRWRPLLVAIVCGIAAFGYAAPKLLPTGAYLASGRFQDDRAMGLPDPITVEMVARAYLDPYQTRRSHFLSQVYGWHEYGNYIGAPAALLIVSALVWVLLGGGRKTTRWLGEALALTAAVLFLLSLGEVGPFAPATLSRAIPLLARYRLPSRYTISFVLFATTLAGWALRELSFDLASSRRAQGVVAAICLIASADLIERNGSHFVGVFDQRPLNRSFRLLQRSPMLVTDTTIDAYGPDAPMLRAMMANRSTFNCYEPLKLAQIADPHEPLVFGDAALKVVSSEFSPNRIAVTVVGGPDASRLFVNQSYSPDWHSTLGPVTPAPRYRNISVAVPPEADGRYSVTFSPSGLVSGCLIFGVAVAASARLWTAKLPDS